MSTTSKTKKFNMETRRQRRKINERESAEEARRQCLSSYLNIPCDRDIIVDSNSDKVKTENEATVKEEVSTCIPEMSSDIISAGVNHEATAEQIVIKEELDIENDDETGSGEHWAESLEARINESEIIGVKEETSVQAANYDIGLHTESQVKCTKCAKVFKNKDTLRKHMQRFHNLGRIKNRSAEPCVICERRFGKDAMQEHLRLHTMERPYTCSNCHHTCRTRRDLKAHLKKHLAASEGKYVCSYCNKRFINQSQLNWHVVCHDNSRQLGCSHCDKKYKTKGGLNIHIRNAHDDSTLHKCSKCTFQCRNMYSFRKHMRIQHEGKRTFPGRHCPKVFQCYSSRYIHTKQRHPKDGQVIYKHVCAFCDKGCHTKFELFGHICSHIHEKPFMCKSCGNGFSTLSQKVEHAGRVHASNKPHKCVICQMCFTTKKGLNRHQKRHQEPELPFKCVQCKLSFMDQRRLKLHHTRIHKVDKETT